MNLDFFEDDLKEILIAPFAMLQKGAALSFEKELIHEVNSIAKNAPFRHMITPGGFRMSVAMTCCGKIGWTTNRKGYQYVNKDPESGKVWPNMPSLFSEIAHNAAKKVGFADFYPDAGIINCYQIGAKLSLHQDKDECNYHAPVVTISLGLPAIFLFGGLNRTDKKQRIELTHGDIFIFGGSSRLNYHAILPVKKGVHPLVGEKRISITLRQAQ